MSSLENCYPEQESFSASIFAWVYCKVLLKRGPFFFVEAVKCICAPGSFLLFSSPPAISRLLSPFRPPPLSLLPPFPPSIHERMQHKSLFPFSPLPSLPPSLGNRGAHATPPPPPFRDPSSPLFPDTFNARGSSPPPLF